MKILYLLYIISLLLFVPAANAYFVGSASIHAPAVIVNTSRGMMTDITLNVSTGNGAIEVLGPKSVGNSTVQSAYSAVAYATAYLGVNETKYNFTYTIKDVYSNISGPSAGAALTLLAISALSHKPLMNNFTMTGTIQPNGNIGEIGGVYDKISAAAASHMKFIMVPYAGTTGIEPFMYYLGEKTFGIDVVSVKNISQALGYATGMVAPVPVNFSINYNYNVSGLRQAGISCRSCTQQANSSFYSLVNYTLNFTSSEIQAMNSTRYGALKHNMLNSINVYSQIARKGYLYAAADFAFLEYPYAYIVVNQNDLNAPALSAMINNTSAYCSSLTPPALTNANYEYVIGGVIRENFANTSIEEAKALVDNPETTDQLIEAEYQLATAQGWCDAASYMYSSASAMGGNYVATSPNLQQDASQYLQRAEAYGSNIYMKGALYFYNRGEYPESIYDSIYAISFYNLTLVPAAANATALGNMINTNMSNMGNGIWPSQFGNEALFYINEANLTRNSSMLGGAYELIRLSDMLGIANAQISSSFVQTAAPQQVQIPQNVSSELSSINNAISQIYFFEIITDVILILVLAELTIILLRRNDAAQARMQQTTQEQPKQQVAKRQLNERRNKER